MGERVVGEGGRAVDQANDLVDDGLLVAQGVRLLALADGEQVLGDAAQPDLRDAGVALVRGQRVLGDDGDLRVLESNGGE